MSIVADFHVIIPCKALAEGKSRLAPVLSRAARYELCAAMLQQTLTVALNVVSPSHIGLTTPDDFAKAMAFKFGTNVLADDGKDLNRALELARTVIQARSGELENGLMVLPIDLPLISAESLGRFVAGGADVTIWADRAGTGTNALFLKGAAAIHFPFHYGRDSFYRHRELGRASRYELRIINDLALALDLDDPDDLALVPIVAANARRCSAFSTTADRIEPAG